MKPAMSFMELTNLPMISFLNVAVSHWEPQTMAFRELHCILTYRNAVMNAKRTTVNNALQSITMQINNNTNHRHHNNQTHKFRLRQWMNQSYHRPKSLHHRRIQQTEPKQSKNHQNPSNHQKSPGDNEPNENSIASYTTVVTHIAQDVKQNLVTNDTTKDHLTSTEPHTQPQSLSQWIKSLSPIVKVKWELVMSNTQLSSANYGMKPWITIIGPSSR